MRIKAEERKKLKQITDLALDIQELRGHAFVNFSGHVGTVEITIYKRGWSEGAKRDYESEYYLSSGRGTFYGKDVDECIKDLKRIKKELSKNI